MNARLSLNPQKEGSSTALEAAPPPGFTQLRSEEALPDRQARLRVVAAVTRHHDLVWRALRRFGVPERDVADAAQQVFLTFADRLSEVEAGKEPSFLAAVSVRVAANARRKLQRSPLVLSDTLETIAAPMTPEALLNQKQMREELDRGLATLPDEQRAVFVLFEIEGFSLPEIADTLDIPLGTATSRLRRARTHFETWAAARGVGAGDEP